jgi:hypothetical protein
MTALPLNHVDCRICAAVNSWMDRRRPTTRQAAHDSSVLSGRSTTRGDDGPLAGSPVVAIPPATPGRG